MRANKVQGPEPTNATRAAKARRLAPPSCHDAVCHFLHRPPAPQPPFLSARPAAGKIPLTAAAPCRAYARWRKSTRERRHAAQGCGRRTRPWRQRMWRQRQSVKAVVVTTSATVVVAPPRARLRRCRRPRWHCCRRCRPRQVRRLSRHSTPSATRRIHTRRHQLHGPSRRLLPATPRAA